MLDFHPTKKRREFNDISKLCSQHKFNFIRFFVENNSSLNNKNNNNPINDEMKYRTKIQQKSRVSVPNKKKSISQNDIYWKILCPILYIFVYYQQYSFLNLCSHENECILKDI